MIVDMDIDLDLKGRKMAKYSVILSDCPWAYNDRAGKRGADKKYDVLTTRELAMIRIGDLAAENCAHFMWATGPMLPDAIKLMKIWGFDYKNIAFTWIKENQKSEGLFSGMGHYTRACAEYVLLGIKGKLERQSRSVHSVVIAPRQGHSSKPQEVRDRIVELFGDVPRVELFARSKDFKWRQTGIEMDGLDIREFIEEEVPVKRKVVELLKGRTQVRAWEK